MSDYSLPSGYSIPYATIDTEHRQLVGMLNQLAADLTVKAAVQVGPAVARFLQSLQEHFQSEQRLMQHMGYPKLSEHRTRHWLCHRAVASILVNSVERNELDHDTVDEVFVILLDLVARVDLDFRAFLVAAGSLPPARSMVVARWPSPMG